MATEDKPRAINRVQHSALIGAATIIAYYNQTITGTVRAIASHFGIEADSHSPDYYGHLSDELTSSGVSSDTPEQIVASIMRHYNLEVVDEP